MKKLITALMFCLLLTLSGCAGCNNQWSNFKAREFGTNWLIVQYNMHGEVLFYWELQGGSVTNEGHSDGIFFTTPGGVVHLSGHYIYVQNPTDVIKNQLVTSKLKNSAK